MMVAVAKIAKQEGLEEGFRIIINDGANSCKFSFTLGINDIIGQSVFHLHLHILGCKGVKFTWPPGTSK
jgi:histidine triad (HIT) family protein